MLFLIIPKKHRYFQLRSKRKLPRGNRTLCIHDRCSVIIVPNFLLSDWFIMFSFLIDGFGPADLERATIFKYDIAGNCGLYVGPRLLVIIIYTCEQRWLHPADQMGSHTAACNAARLSSWTTPFHEQIDDTLDARPTVTRTWLRRPSAFVTKALVRYTLVWRLCIKGP